MKNGKLNTPLFKWLTPFVIATALISGCSDSGEGTSSDTQSRLYVSLTDAEGDFTQYKVDVDALKLYRANGAVIETLPNKTTLDFVQYIDVTEFLTTATVPVGNYTHAEITLDFSDAELSVENASGDSIPATAVDDDSNPLGSVTLTTYINGNRGFTIRPGQPASLTIDFDLEASNEVEIDSSGNSATVTVNPVLVANTEIDDDKSRRLRGLLDSVDEAAESFIVDIRPFRIRHRSHGEITVLTDDSTLYEVDGESHGADTGLRALAQLEAFSPIVVLGSFNLQLQTYTAAEVYAGSSVPWGQHDIVKGSVTSRSGNTLTVLGATIELDDGRFQFNDKITVTIDDATSVTKQGSDTSVSIADISVGQRVTVLGDMVDDMTMDATVDGLVRMRYSDISGSVVSVSPLEVDVQNYNRRNINQFNFSGTGTDAGNDADPEQYEVDSGSLSLNNLDISNPVKVRGFPTAFGTAPLDFSAKTIIEVSQVNSKIVVNYTGNGAADAVAALDENGLLLSLDSAVGRHHLIQAGIATDLNDLTSMPLIAPNDGAALYTIQQHRSLRIYTQWQEFEQALNGALAEGKQVVHVHSHGEYDSASLTLLTRHLIIRITE